MFPIAIIFCNWSAYAIYFTSNTAKAMGGSVIYTDFAWI
ncbi:MAG TPA: hypothetical protein DCE09_04355 [Thermoanaerobacter sp.]|nr:hypothetical protein [Thermoanaerobacter sp.]